MINKVIKAKFLALEALLKIFIIDRSTEGHQLSENLIFHQPVTSVGQNLPPDCGQNKEDFFKFLKKKETKTEV
ncbi:hypothetical protein AYI68_g7817 [Smittium mucronatum]|uniref:Uncharacterized protein n=1 Tax=Smittium mucronatum TaxID=133383 RepID=A0A1R0GML6_9FUNG|nr:hypothetical protein AYI68_g7817 [Smittium mucronatum]